MARYPSNVVHVRNKIWVKAKHYLWLLALLAFLGIPLVALHSLHLKTNKQKSCTICAPMLPLHVSGPVGETISLKQVKENYQANFRFEKKFYSSGYGWHFQRSTQADLHPKSCSSADFAGAMVAGPVGPVQEG